MLVGVHVGVSCISYSVVSYLNVNVIGLITSVEEESARGSCYFLLSINFCFGGVSSSSWCLR